jgi:hypothetical protein
MNVGVSILRLPEGLDCSEMYADIEDLILTNFQGSSYQSYEWPVTADFAGYHQQKIKLVR